MESPIATRSPRLQIDSEEDFDASVCFSPSHNVNYALNPLPISPRPIPYLQKKRVQVFSHFDPDVQFIPPVIPKTPEEKQKIQDVLKDQLLFKHLNSDQLSILIDALSVEKHSKGDVVIKQGEEGKLFYIVYQGLCHIYRRQSEEKVQSPSALFTFNPNDLGDLVQTRKPGDCFGELALLHSWPRQATVVVEENDTTLFVVDAKTFHHMLRSFFQKESNVGEETNQVDELTISSSASASSS